MPFLWIFQMRLVHQYTPAPTGNSGKSLPAAALFIIVLAVCALVPVSVTAQEFLEKIPLIKEARDLKAENEQLKAKIQELETQISSLKTRLIPLETENAELKDQITRRALYVQEMERNLQRYQTIAATKEVLETRVGELQTAVKKGEKKIRELEEELSRRPPIPEEAPRRFAEGDCVQWYGSVYKEREKMTGVIVQIREKKAYLVRCTMSEMPFLWAENALYELGERILEPCR